MTAHYYNEFDEYAAKWLRNLIAAGHIPAGDVDERSIADVRPDDLAGYTQCHFFAGIGGWALAARLAGWPDDKELWTGSCPCQPFSTAGRNEGFGDERHLWPIWMRLIAERRPPVVFGEQVANAVSHGWLDAVFTDLEAEGYACGAAILPAAGAGAPHVRDRLWFVAYADVPQREGSRVSSRIYAQDSHTCAASADADVADAFRERQQGPRAYRDAGDSAPHGERQAVELVHGGFRDFWRVEPAVGRVANGVPARVGKLRALGNAIVPQVAAEVIAAYMECRP